MPYPSTDRTAFRPLNTVDAQRVFEMFSDPDAMRYWSHPVMREIAEAERYIEKAVRFNESGTGIQWGLVSRAHNELIGTCTFHQWSRENRRAEVGYMLSRSHWGQGLMTEALEAFLAYGFGEMDLNRVEADIDPANEASARLLQRLGFVQEGILRERWIVGGVRSDTAYFGLLRNEWNQDRSAT